VKRGRRLQQGFYMYGDGGDRQVATVSTEGRNVMALPEDSADITEWYDTLGDFLGLQIQKLDNDQLKIIQKKLQIYYALPRIGEIIMVWQKGGHVITDFEFRKRGGINVIAFSLDTGISLAIPLSELTLSPSGVWVRDAQGVWETVQQGISWLRLPGWFGASMMHTWKHERMFTWLRHNVIPLRFHGVRYFNAMIITGMSLIPMNFELVWDNTVGYFTDPGYREIISTDPTLPLGTRTYVNAINGEEQTGESNSLFDKFRDVGHNIVTGAQSFVGGAKQTVKDVVDRSEELVTKMFYGAVVLGGMFIAIKVL